MEYGFYSFQMCTLPMSINKTNEPEVLRLIISTLIHLGCIRPNPQREDNKRKWSCKKQIEKTLIGKDTCTPKFIHALFTTVKLSNNLS